MKFLNSYIDRVGKVIFIFKISNSFDKPCLLLPHSFSHTQI